MKGGEADGDRTWSDGDRTRLHDVLERFTRGTNTGPREPPKGGVSSVSLR